MQLDQISEARKVYGPYKGSKENKGRPHYVIKYTDKNGKWHTTSENAARKDYEDDNNVDLPKDVHVDHKDNDRHNDNKSNLRAIKGSKNIGKENKRRAGK